MGRHIIDVQLDLQEDFVERTIDFFAQKYNMKLQYRGGERYLEVKDAVFGGTMCFKHTYRDGRLYIEAWLRDFLGNESDLEGNSKGSLKKAYRMRLDELMNTLYMQQPYMQNGQDSTKEILLLILSIVSVVTACALPLISLILAIVTYHVSCNELMTCSSKLLKNAAILSRYVIIVGAFIWVSIIILTIIPIIAGAI